MPQEVGGVDVSFEEIKHAAVISQVGMIFLGKSHADCFHQMAGVGIKPLTAAKAQGFFTSHGRFVDRDTAAKLAFQAGQIRHEASCLLSEDLWSDRHEGTQKYDSVKGYSPK